MRRHWPQLRAVIVTFHVVALILVNIPAPTGSPLALTGHDASAAEELVPWARLLKMPQEELVAKLLAIRARWLALRASVIAPFSAYQALAGAEQPWQMFSSPNRMPASLMLEVWDGRAWRSLGGLPLGDWRPALFNSERTRSLVNTMAREAAHPELDDLCRALGRRALADHPTATQARCHILLRRSPSLRDRGEPMTESTLHVLIVERPR